ncbi:MAG: hypothetical protein PHW79_03700 [Candidatus Marinimicrobia bacterium]|nr:hypothetical protein [Candidatus Neomarinimicrobiota bacterium]
MSVLSTMKIIDKGKTMLNNNLKAKTGMPIILLITALLFAMSCKECPTEPEDPDLSLSAPYLETSIVWLKISSSESTTSKSFIVQRDTIVVLESSFHGKDTLIADRTVQPNTSYTYTLNYVDHGKIQDETESVTITTLDISNSDFTWEVYRFGDEGNENWFRSVSIVNENNIWIVGTFRCWGWDSLYSAYGYVPYNTVHWNGTNWDTVSIAPKPFGFSSLDAVCAINDSVVWAGVDAIVQLKNGQWLARTDSPDLSWMMDIWGNSVSNTYFAYYDGGIVHFNGTSFEIMSSGTTTNLQDIDGNDERVFITGFKTTIGYDKLLLEYKNGQWQKVFTSSTASGDLSNGDLGRPYSVKALDDVAVISTAAAATVKYYYHDGIMDIWPEKATPLCNYVSVERIDGNAINDLALITNGGQVVHYNGRDYTTVFDYDVSGYSGDPSIYGGDFKDDVICAVGDVLGQALVIIGRR